MELGQSHIYDEALDPSLPKAGPKRPLKLLSLPGQIEFATSGELGHRGLEYIKLTKV